MFNALKTWREHAAWLVLMSRFYITIHITNGFLHEPAIKIKSWIVIIIID